MKEKKINKYRGITVVSPMFGDLSITNRMVFSVISQFISKEQPFKIHLVLVDDYIEGRGKNNESPYEFYLSDEFKKLYNTDLIEISLIKNETHKYQGESRQIGFMAGKYKYFLLVDCDDMLSPNACERYLNAIDSTHKMMKENNQPVLPIACVYGLLYSFDIDGYEHNIVGDSIWVQSRCYNRDFIIKHNISFPTGTNSKQAEDYPFIRKLDYAIKHDTSYATVALPYNDPNFPMDCQATAFWFPNHESLSRKDPHYTQHLAGWTMKSSFDIIKYYERFNEENNIEDEEDEFMKMEILNMAIYAYYNILDFLREVAMTDYEPLEEDWYAVRDSVAKLRLELKKKYWNELCYSDVADMLYNVKNNSDCHFVESWISNFYDYIEKDDVLYGKKHPILTMNYKEMITYCKGLEFDEALHEIHSPQVLAWKRHHDID